MSNILKYKTSDDSKIMHNDWFDEQTTGEQYQEDGWWCAVLNEGVDFMGQAFSYTNVTDVIIPNGITDISYAFEKCTELKEVLIPESLTTIGDSAFAGCTGLTEFVIPEGITTIDDYAFTECTGLTKVTIPESVTELGESAFAGCTSFTEFVIPESVTELGESVFMDCTGLTKVTIPESITELSVTVFLRCSGFTEFVIPEWVSTIGGSVFKDCTGLTKVTIQSGTELIDSLAFDNCSNLKEVTCTAVIPPELTIATLPEEASPFHNTPENKTLYVLKDSVEAYKNSLWANDFSYILPIPDPEPAYGFNLSGMIDTDYMCEI